MGRGDCHCLRRYCRSVDCLLIPQIVSGRVRQRMPACGTASILRMKAYQALDRRLVVPDPLTSLPIRILGVLWCIYHCAVISDIIH
jgi:hypothetical protein